MDGTVSCANLDEGRPALAGTAAGATGTGVVFSTGATEAAGVLVLGETVVGIGLAGALEAGLGTGLVAARGFGTGTACGLDAVVVALATGFAGTFFAGAAALVAGLAGLADLTGALLATGLAGAAFGEGLAGFFATGLLTVAAGLTAGFALGLPAAGALDGAAVALLFFPGLAFTSCLLAERVCSWSVVPAVPLLPLEGSSGGASPARECTGFAIGKPISCKIETIIWLSIRKNV